MEEHIKKLFCPFCGEKMKADLHAPEDGAMWVGQPPQITTKELRAMDNWTCLNCPITNSTIIITREELDSLLLR